MFEVLFNQTASIGPTKNIFTIKKSRFFIKNILIILLFNLISYNPSWASKGKYLPTHYRINADVYHLVKYFFMKNKPFKIELGLDMDLNRLLFNTEYSYSWINSEFQNKKNQFKHRGHVMKVGLDYNFFSNSVESNAVFLGLRGAYSFFNYELHGEIEDECYMLYNQRIFSNRRISKRLEDIGATWLEVILGFKVSIYKNFHMGHTVRLKCWKKLYNNPSHCLPYYIPDFGRQSYKAESGLSCYIAYNIPVKRVNKSFFNQMASN